MRNRHLKSRGLSLALAAGLLTVPALALATPTFQHYHVTFTTLNNSGVTGFANLELDNSTNMLTVTIDATGLVPNQVHMQHIHGPFNAAGQPIQATLTDLGSPLLPLTSPPGLPPTGTYPTASASGTIDFSETYNLSDNIYFAGFDESDLLPLTFRAIMIHGIDVNGQYEPMGMAAAGIIAAPEPSSIFDMLAGLGAMLALVGFGRRRMRHGKVC
ncbi:MAG: CHRD domain-containing protein [Rhodanobacteraceae bacterium]